MPHNDKGENTQRNISGGASCNIAQCNEENQCEEKWSYQRMDKESQTRRTVETESPNVQHQEEINVEKSKAPVALSTNKHGFTDTPSKSKQLSLPHSAAASKSTFSPYENLTIATPRAEDVQSHYINWIVEAPDLLKSLPSIKDDRVQDSHEEK